MGDQVLHVHQLIEMAFDLGVAPAGVFADLSSGKVVFARLHMVFLTVLADHLRDAPQKFARLGGKLVEGGPEHMADQTVGDFDVLQGHLDILDHFALMHCFLDLALILTQNRTVAPAISRRNQGRQRTAAALR